MKRYIALTIALLCGVSASTSAEDIYVSQKGKSSAFPKSKTFATVAEALSAGAGKKDCKIILADGIYVLDKGVVISPQTGFASDSKITLTAENFGKATLRLDKQVNKEQVKPLSDKAIAKRLRPEVKDKVYEIDLDAVGVNVKEFPVLFATRTNFPELIYNGDMLPLSRYPNEGKYLTMKKVLDNFGTSDRGGIFEYSDSRHEAWGEALKEGLWFTGFWRIPWQSHTVKISEINAKDKTVTHAIGIETKDGRDVGVFGGIGSKYKRPGGDGKENYYAINLVEEIDVPGEWALDFKRKKIYIYMPEKFDGAGLSVLAKNEPVIKVKDMAKTTIEGLVIENGMGNGIEIFNGASNTIAGCTIRNVLGHGVLIDGGVEHKLISSDINNVGRSGVEVYGGDRTTLTPCNHLVENNYITQCGKIQTSYAPAICVGRYRAAGGDSTGENGVGIRARHNLIHDLPHASVLFVGNLNVLEFNEIFDIAKLTGDVGAFYSCADWTSRGNVIRDNLIHNIPRANGTYHDDGQSGDSVYRNIICDAGCGTMIGGGHDNYISNNLYIDCKRAIALDARGKSRNYTKANPKYTKRFTKYKIGEGNWQRVFPEMSKFLDRDSLDYPHANYIGKNYIYSSKDVTPDNAKDRDMKFSFFDANIPVRLSQEAIDKIILDGKLPNTIAIKASENYGLYTDAYRKTLPDRAKIIGVLKAQKKSFDSTKDITATNKAQSK